MADKDTTKKGVSDGNQVKTTDDLISEQGALDRDNDVNDIVANSRIARELEAAGVDMTNPMEVDLAKQKLEKGEDPNPNAGKVDPGEEEGGDSNLIVDDDDDPAPEMVMVKINGVESEVLKSEVDEEGGVVAYQKNRSADEKMRQAADQRKVNETKEKELAERELAISHKEQASLSNEDISDQSSKDAGQPSAEAVALKDKMYSGDENKTAEAIDTILERSKPSTPIDTETVVSQAVAQVQWQNELTQAKVEFQSEYKDIESNPEYRAYADQATLRIKAENPKWGPRQIIMEAGEQARLKFRDEIRESTGKAEEEERLNNKRTTDNVHGNNAKSVKQPVQKAKSPSEIVEGMQANRSHATI